jgi:3-hydroxyisobutyrate dehydrogenase-like beta-hydroxyacid dehydrogenase
MPPIFFPVSIRCVGVAGLGRMGHAYAQDLLSDGYKIIMHDRDEKRVRDVQAGGGIESAHYPP